MTTQNIIEKKSFFTFGNIIIAIIVIILISSTFKKQDEDYYILDKAIAKCQTYFEMKIKSRFPKKLHDLIEEGLVKFFYSKKFKHQILEKKNDKIDRIRIIQDMYLQDKTTNNILQNEFECELRKDDKRELYIDKFLYTERWN